MVLGAAAGDLRIGKMSMNSVGGVEHGGGPTDSLNVHELRASCPWMAAILATCVLHPKRMDRSHDWLQVIASYPCWSGTLVPEAPCHRLLVQELPVLRAPNSGPGHHLISGGGGAAADIATEVSGGGVLPPWRHLIENMTDPISLLWLLTVFYIHPVSGPWSSCLEATWRLPRPLGNFLHNRGD